MLKAYAIENLRAGMIIGRDVLDESTNVLIGAGTVLNNDMIFSLLDRPIFSVYVEEAEPVIEATFVPGREFLLDDAYMTCYDRVHHQLKVIFTALAERGTFNASALQELTDEKNFLELCNGSKAVSQMHNMNRQGDYLINHCLHVGIMAGMMGKWLNWSVLDQYNLVIAGLFLDIGKMRIAPEILEKKGKLTPAEFDIVKKHPQAGYELIDKTTLRSNQDIMWGVLQHHERCDGSGYPSQLDSSLIDDFAMITAIADVYDAMTAARRYRAPLCPFAVISSFESEGFTKYNTKFLLLFLKKLATTYQSNRVMLNDSRFCNIVMLNPHELSRPIVRFDDGSILDLSTNREFFIKSVM